MRQQFCQDVSQTSETPENVNFHASARFGMDVSADDTGSRGGNYQDIEHIGDPKPGDPEPGVNTMKKTIKRVAPWLATAAVSGALLLAPTASAATTTHTGPSHANQTSTETGASPFVPFGAWAPRRRGALRPLH